MESLHETILKSRVAVCLNISQTAWQGCDFVTLLPVVYGEATQENTGQESRFKRLQPLLFESLKNLDVFQLV